MMHNFATSKSTSRTAAHLLILLAGVLLFAVGCSKTANTNSSNASTTNQNSTASTISTTSTSTSSSSTASSPIAGYKAFQEASKRKDYAAVKSRFSKASLEMLTEEAKKQNKTLDEFIKDQVDKGTTDEQVLNEKIDGDSATVELKDKNSSATLPMVKEDGEWKIAYDRFMKQMQEAIDKMNKGAKPSTGNHNGSENVNEDDK